jgi:(p)ppGpp synthase/HD superfamily hydrolase
MRATDQNNRNMDNVKWCIEQHAKTNHWYDTYLPYEFHLRMVNQAAKDFESLLDDEKDYFSGKNKEEMQRRDAVTLKEACLLATWGHDLIEDTRVSYNDVKENLGQEAADIIYACTNEKGKNRKERANDNYYEGIRNTPGGVFVKMCDRIANVQYSKMTKSRMFEMYKNENENFTEKLGFQKGVQHHLAPMYNYLIELFEK